MFEKTPKANQAVAENSTLQKKTGFSLYSISIVVFIFWIPYIGVVEWDPRFS